MTQTPDYQRYTMDELLDVQVHIDRDRFPERYEMLCAEIQRRREQAAQPPPTPQATVQSPSAAATPAPTTSKAQASAPTTASRQSSTSSAHTYTPHWLPLVSISALLILLVGTLYFGFAREPIQEAINDHNTVLQALNAAYPEQEISVEIKYNNNGPDTQLILGLSARGTGDSNWAQLPEAQQAAQTTELVMTAYNAYPNPQRIGEIVVAFQNETDLSLVSTKQIDYAYRYNRSDLKRLREITTETK